MSPIRSASPFRPIAFAAVLLTSCLNQVDSATNSTAQTSAELGEAEDGGSPSVDGPSFEPTALPDVDEADQTALSVEGGTVEQKTDAVGHSAPNNGACPDDMVEVKGDFCPSVLEECLGWVDKDHTNKHGVVDPNMCAEFRFPTQCLSSNKIPMHFCVDRYEWPNRKGETPATRMSWVEAKSACEGIGKRLCKDDEWTLACEGPDMKPYPYGDGYHRDSNACNADRNPWIDPWANPFSVVDKRAPSGSHEACHSDWGVYDIVGNADEWVHNTRGNPNHQPWVSGLMGGHWVHGVRNRCRAMTDSHEPNFSFYVTGARCCADAGSE